jgi:hypothetical protein
MRAFSLKDPDLLVVSGALELKQDVCVCVATLSLYISYVRRVYNTGLSAGFISVIL